MFGIQKVVGTWGELALGPLLLVIGLFMLVGDRLNLPQFGFSGNACAADGQFLRQDAEGAEMDESPCGNRIYSHRHLFLLDNVCINKSNN